MRNLLSRTVLLFLGLQIHVNAQIKLLPLSTDHARAAESQAHKQLSRIKVNDTIGLPFFEDFSDYAGRPHADRWLQTGGAYVNDRFGVNAPSMGVATFDGLDAKGNAYKPYEQSAVNNRGFCDTLISLPIDLSLGVANPADSLYLSFYWQGEGLGEQPDVNDYDSLYLQFRDSAGIWRSVWGKTGEALAPFRLAAIPITDLRYFYKGFQFRFGSHGNRTGGFDTWNIDYIKLEPRLPFGDLALSNPPGSVLKRYHSMPYDHFVLNPMDELRDSLTLHINRIGTQFIIWESRATMTTFPSFTLDSLETNQQNFGLLEPAPGNPDSVTFTSLKYAVPKGSYIGATQGSESMFFLVDPGVTGSKLRNDTLRYRTSFSDYFAYDDGSCEYGMGIEGFFGGKLAFRYSINKQDTVTSIDIYFIQLGKAIPGQLFDLSILTTLTGGGAKYQKGYQVAYSDSIDKFTRYMLDSPVIVSGTFYIVLEQFTGDYLNIGIDRNNRANQHIFFNVDTQNWNPFIEDRDVAPMVRPVFSDPAIVGVKENLVSGLVANVYPNPANDMLFIEGAVSLASITDMTGKQVVFHKFDPFTELNTIDVSQLKRGMYILVLKNNGAVSTKKILIQ